MKTNTSNQKFNKAADDGSIQCRFSRLNDKERDWLKERDWRGERARLIMLKKRDLRNGKIISWVYMSDQW